MTDPLGNQISPIQSFSPPVSDAEAVDITPKTQLFAMRDTVVVPDTSNTLAQYQSGFVSGGSTTQAGSGNSVFMVDPSQGIWLGAALFASAPFSVDMQGNLIALAGTFKGTFILGGTLETISDITKLQAAITAVGAAGGGTVALVPATYNATTSFTIPSNVTIDMNGSTVDFGGGAHQFLVQGATAYSTGTISATFGSATITGVGTTWTAAMIGQSILLGEYWYTITARASNTSVTISTAFNGTNLVGDTYVIATTVNNANLLNGTVQNSSISLVKVRYANTFTASGITCITGDKGFDYQDSANAFVLNYLVSTCTTNGIYVNNSPFMVISDGLVTSGAGISITRSSNTAIEILSCQAITGVGVSLTNCHDIGFVNYAIIECTSHGIEFVSGNNDIQVNNGQTDTTGGDGIKLTASSNRINISLNSFLNATGYGINIANANDNNNIISNNAFNNNTAGNLHDLGTSTKIRGNQGVSDNIVEGDLSMTDITTNDVSTSKHGFMPKATGSTSTFYRSDGTQATPPSGSVTYKNGTTTKNRADASTTQNIAHGLGVAPKYVRLTARCIFSTSSMESDGVYNGTTTATVYRYDQTGVGFGVETTNIIRTDDGNHTNMQNATVTVDATNIILTWTKTASPTGTIQILWEAEA